MKEIFEKFEKIGYQAYSPNEYCIQLINGKTYIVIDLQFKSCQKFICDGDKIFEEPFKYQELSLVKELMECCI